MVEYQDGRKRGHTAGVCGAVATRKGDELVGGWLEGSAPGDGDLGTFRVELLDAQAKKMS